MSLPAKTLDGVPDYVHPGTRDRGRFGSYPVSGALLREALGERTWTVWLHCYAASRKTGRYWMENVNALPCLNKALAIKKRAPLSEVGLRKAFRRLIAAGLLTHTACPKGGGRWQNYRGVKGWFKPSNDPTNPSTTPFATIFVPPQTVTWMKRATPNWGGKRAGAGRPMGSKNRPLVPTEKESSGVHQQSRGVQHIQPVVNKQLDPFYYVERMPADAPPALPSQKQQQPVAVAVPVETPKAVDEPAVWLPPAEGLVETSHPELGASLRGKMTPGGRPPPPGVGGVPRYPGPTVMPPATVPGPPELPAGLSDSDAVERLLKAFRGAVAARTKKPCWVLGRKGSVEKSPYFGLLVKAAREMEDRQWRPGAWVMWRFDTWDEMQGGRKREPPLKWVFSLEAMDEHGGWFESEAQHYSAPRIIYNAFAQDVLRKYQSMQLELLRRGAASPGAVREVVEKHWPGDSYRQAVQRANARTQEDQMLINRRVQSGAWIW